MLTTSAIDAAGRRIGHQRPPGSIYSSSPATKSCPIRQQDRQRWQGPKSVDVGSIFHLVDRAPGQKLIIQVSI